MPGAESDWVKTGSRSSKPAVDRFSHYWCFKYEFSDFGINLELTLEVGSVILPSLADGMMLDVERLYVGISDRQACGVVAGLEVGLHHETS